MKLSDNQNAILTALALVIGTGSGGVAVRATTDASEQRDNLREWTLAIQKQVAAHDVALARLQAWREGYECGRRERDLR